MVAFGSMPCTAPMLTLSYLRFLAMQPFSSSTSSETVPVLEKGRANIDAWERRFNDYCILKKWRGILLGTEARPIALTQAELHAIPAASRYTAGKDRQREIDDYNDRSEAAFAGICKAMQEDLLIYASAELDLLRQADQHDPVAAYTYVFACLRPSHVDAQMTAEAKISTFLMQPDETVPAAYQRLLSYVNCLEVPNRPDDNTLKRHMKRAIKNNPTASRTFLNKVETLMEREPPLTFAEFCQGLLRKHEEQLAEIAQEAALLTETKQASSHTTNESEKANFTSQKGGRGGKGKGSRGRGRGRSMGKGQYDSRIGALYYGKGSFAAADSYHENGGSFHQPFYRGGFRQNGGRGYNFGGKGKGRGQDSNVNTYKRPADNGDHQGKGQFQGYCSKCNHWGHKHVDCYAKRPRV